MDVPWSRMTANRTHPSMALADPRFDETEGLKLSLTVNPASAEKFFAGSGHSFAEIAALGKDRKPLPRFPLMVSIQAKAKIEKTTVESANVIAKLPGSDATLKNEYVVLSAHVDHLGIGAPINGDKIYNGAMDNASGDAVLLDEAASLKKSGEKLKRSLLFAFVTGEEKGLLGSRYFAGNPTVPANSMVADINIDMFLPLFPLKILTVYGLQESDLGDLVTKVANDRGIRIQSDPEPLRNVFIRSDQYSFIRVGIPSLTMKVGFDKGTPEEQMVKDWRTNRYHAPSDDLNQPVDLSAAVGYEEIMRRLMIAVANDPQRPQWKQDSFFRRYAQAAGN
jgi:Zn-dependent M28 family amino/carboxypeptidase